METDVEGLLGAGRHERSGGRTTCRNGHWDRPLDTWLGALQLRIPTLRQDGYFPPFLDPRKISEKALVAVIQEAWARGISTRRVDTWRRRRAGRDQQEHRQQVVQGHRFISDAHEGLGAAIRRVVGGFWQRCQVLSPGFMPASVGHP
jgi:transposase-like protein